MKNKNDIVYAHRINVTDIVDRMKVNQPKTIKEREELINALADFINAKFKFSVLIKKTGLILTILGIIGAITIDIFLLEETDYIPVCILFSILGMMVFLFGMFKYSEVVSYIAPTLAKIRDEGLKCYNDNL